MQRFNGNASAVNVEAQLASPSSLLTWMRRIIAVRRRSFFDNVTAPSAGVPRMGETTYFSLLSALLKWPILSVIRTRWDILRACIFCMTAAL
jgi:hypothetical protein